MARRDGESCPKQGCRGHIWFESYCGAYVCDICSHHDKLSRCYCGWAADGGNGRQQLEDMGENLEDL